MVLSVSNIAFQALIWTVHYYHLTSSILPRYLLRDLMGNQSAKKVVSDSPGPVDFAIRLVIFVLNLPDRQVLFFLEIQFTEGL